MLACYKIYLKVMERTENFEKFDLKIMIKDFIISRDARRGKQGLLENTNNQLSPEKAKNLSLED
jgi:hypothetical protein